MRTILWIHIAGGGLSLLAGYAALWCAKGSERHRWLGRVFFYAMLTMGLTGALIAALTAVETSVVMGFFASYLVFTGFTAVASFGNRRVIDLAGAVVACVLTFALADIGQRALVSPGGAIEGLPAPMAFVFAAVAALAGASDLRLLARPGLGARAKLVRHLWRMCFALFIAAASFFLGQMDEIPQALRTPALLALPVLTPIVVMGFWIWRTRSRRITSALVRAPSEGEAG